MPVLIEENGGGLDKSKGLTATAADIVWGKTALVGGRVVTGTMGTLLKDMPVGSIVKSEVNGVLRNFIVVHQGKPSDIYSSTFDNSTILLMEDIYEKRQWNPENGSDYAASAIHAYLNGTLLDQCSAVIKNKVKQVKIPYRPGPGNGTGVSSGENGLTAKIWLPSGRETGYTNATFLPPDGAKFSFFLSGNADDANDKRRAYLDGSASNWWLRSPFCVSGASYAHVYSALYNGGSGDYDSSLPLGIRPALALSDTIMVLADGTLVG